MFHFLISLPLFTRFLRFILVDAIPIILLSQMVFVLSPRWGFQIFNEVFGILLFAGVIDAIYIKRLCLIYEQFRIKKN